MFNACSNQYNAPTNGWGKQYGGMQTNTCSDMPTELQPGCNWRFDFLGDNPELVLRFEEVV